jgi:hypothetical protein
MSGVFKTAIFFLEGDAELLQTSHRQLQIGQANTMKTVTILYFYTNLDIFNAIIRHQN